MRKATIGLVAIVFCGALAIVNEAGAQGGTAPQSQSMGASRSGSAIDPDQGTQKNKGHFDEGYTGQAPGIGEKGSGQGQSTIERSRGKQNSHKDRSQSSDSSQGNHSSASEKQSHEERDR